jgi:hypothetical protein
MMSAIEGTTIVWVWYSPFLKSKLWSCAQNVQPEHVEDAVRCLTQKIICRSFLKILGFQTFLELHLFCSTPS